MVRMGARPCVHVSLMMAYVPLQEQGLFPITMIFLPYFTSHLTSYSSLRRLPICQCLGSTILEVLHFVCVWIVYGLALVASSGPVDVVPVSSMTNLIMARRA